MQKINKNWEKETIPSGWRRECLDSIMVENSKSPIKVNDADLDGSIPFFTSGENILSHDISIVDGENIYMSTGGVANIHYFNGKASYSTDTYSFRSTEDTKYLYYALLHRIKKINVMHFSGSSLKHLQKSDLKKDTILLPPIDEQEKIAKILEVADESISRIQEVIDTTEKLKKGLMQQLFTRGIGHTEFKQTKLGNIPENWYLVQFRDICKIHLGGTPSTRNPKYWDGNIPWITPRDLTNYKEVYIGNGARNITSTGLKNSSAQLMPVGTILLSSRAPIGYIAIATNEIATNQGFKNLIVNPEKADNVFIYYWLKSNIRLLQTLGTGSTFLEISKDSIEKVTIGLPPLPEQKAMSKILKSLDNKIALHEKKKSELVDTRKGLMQDLLSSRVQVKV